MTARQEAMQTGRNMLVHFWATWCGPCQRLETTVFRQPTVTSTVQQNFVPVKLNADEFPQIARAYGVTVLPTDVILAPDGTVLGKFASPQDPAAYLAQISPFDMAGGSQNGRLVAAGNQQRVQQQPVHQPNVPTVPIASGGRAIQPPYADLQQSGPSNPAGNSDFDSRGAFQAASQVNGNQYGAWVPNAPYGANAGAVAQAADPALALHANGTAPQGGAIPNGGYGARYSSGGAIDRAIQPNVSAPGNPGQYTLPGYQTPTQPGSSGFIGHANSGGGGSSPMATSPSSNQTPGDIAQGTRRSDPASAQSAGGARPSAVATAAPSAAASGPPLGMDGFCPVTLKREQRWVPGDRRFGIVHRGSLYLFASASHAQQFWDSPDNFSPVLSGIDPVLALDNGATVDGQREHGVEYNGMFYLFSSESTLQHFYRNPERYAAGVRQAMQGTRGTTFR